MAPTPGSLSAFSHKTAAPVCFCARPLPFLKAFEERAECVGDARSVRAPTDVCALGIRRLRRPAPTSSRALHPPPRAPRTHRLARPWHPRLVHPLPTASCTLGTYRLARPAPIMHVLGTHRLAHPAPAVSRALHRPNRTPGTDRGAGLASPRSSPQAS